MKLRVTFELPLPPETQPYLGMIAKVFGYSPAVHEMSPEAFVCKQVCEPQVSALFRSLVTSALSSYLGIAGADQVAEVQAQYDATHSATADIVSD